MRHTPLIALLAAVSALGFASSAHAGVLNYCGVPPNPRYYSPNESCVGPRHSLNSNDVRTYFGGTDRVCAGARDGNTYAFYGSFLCGSGSRCHPYAGGLLYGVAHNGTGYFLALFGTEYYGSDAKSGCA